MATIAFSKVFILDKYFNELQKFWETEKKLQGMQQQDSSSVNEAAHLQQKLKNLSSELVTLRNRLHVNQNGQQALPCYNTHPPNNTPNSSIVTTANNGNGSHPLPGVISVGNGTFRHSQPLLIPAVQHVNQKGEPYSIKPLLVPSSNPHDCNSSNGINNLSLNQNSGVLHTMHNNQHNLQQSGNHPNLSNGYYANQNFTKDVVRVNGSGTEIGGCSDDKVSCSLIGTVTTTNSASAGDVTPSESSFKLISSSVSGSGASATVKSQVRLSDIEDLIQLYGPLTEDALIRCIHARCGAAKHYIHMGPILLIANQLNAVGNPLTLTSTIGVPSLPPIQRIVQEALRQQGDTGYPQAIILSGCSGSGKTFTSMLILRQLFELAGGGLNTDAFKHLGASVTVLRSLGTARTATNFESSRIGHFTEVQVTDGIVYRTKVHCYFLDQCRVVRTLAGERNYHIFYQMIAGLSPEERVKLHLVDHTAQTLRYLKSTTIQKSSDEAEDSKRFLGWKTSLGVLGIPFLDVVRVLSAVILIGNVRFLETTCADVEIEGVSECQAAAALLGVSEAALKQGLTTRTHNVRNQLIRSRCDANFSNFARDALAKSLYCRTVATIVRRANSLKRLSSTSGTLSSDSTDSAHNHADTLSQHTSTVGTAGSKASKSMTALNNAVRHATDGFIGILDMFGFEDIRPSHLEHLCINLCAETMQHFYNTHIFKACIESCRDEGIQCDWEVDYMDNVPCIDLISSLKSGLLSMLDVECTLKGTVETYIQKLRLQHNNNPTLLEPKSTDSRSFGIQHYAGKVHYSAKEFLETNRDVIADDLVAVFHKHRCSFGFASHLFSSELKILGAGGMEPSPRGILFRISPTSHFELLNGDEPVTTLTQDFHTRLDNLLRTLVHARPHFIRCIKINHNQQQDTFDRHTVSKQLRAFQVLETMNLMAHGYPHRMRFKAFSARYKLLVPFNQISRTDDRVKEDCHIILSCLESSLGGNARERLGHMSISWDIGKKHIFMSEGARQQLEAVRTSTQNRAATSIQSTWRGWKCRQQRSANGQGFGFRFPRLTPVNSMNSATLVHNSVGASANSAFILNSNPSNVILPISGNNTLFGAAPTVSPPTQISSASSSSAILVGSQISNGLSETNAALSLCSTTRPGRPARSTTSSTPLGQSSTGLPTSPPAIPTQNSTSVATISIVNNTYSSLSSGAVSNITSNSGVGGRPRPQPISGTPPPEAMDRCDSKLVLQTCNLFGLDIERPPPLPPSRSYTVAGNTKLGYPQTRVMKMSFPDDSISAESRLLKDEVVMVVGSSARRGHLLVEHNSRSFDVPFQYLELKPLYSE